MKKVLTVYIEDNCTLATVCGTFITVNEGGGIAASMGTFGVSDARGLYIPQTGDVQVIPREDEPKEAESTEGTESTENA